MPRGGMVVGAVSSSATILPSSDCASSEADPPVPIQVTGPLRVALIGITTYASAADLHDARPRGHGAAHRPELEVGPIIARRLQSRGARTLGDPRRGAEL